VSTDAFAMFLVLMTAAGYQAAFAVAATLFVTIVFGGLAADQRAKGSSDGERGHLLVVFVVACVCGVIAAIFGVATDSNSTMLLGLTFGDLAVVLIGVIAYLFHGPLHTVLYSRINAEAGKRVALPLVLIGLIAAVTVLWQRDVESAPADSATVLVTHGVFHVSGATADGMPDGIHEHVAPSMSARVVPGIVHREGAALPVSCQIKQEKVVRKRMPRSASRIWDRLANGTYVSDLYMDTRGVGTFDPGLPACS
jgi:hypothetical protein